MAPKSKRAKPNQPLGAKSSVSTKPVDDDERDLEEAVFGKSTGGRSVWDLAEDDVLRDDPFDDVDFEEERETGLERVDDDNVSFHILQLFAIAELILDYSCSSWMCLRLVHLNRFLVAAPWFPSTLVTRPRPTRILILPLDLHQNLPLRQLSSNLLRTDENLPGTIRPMRS